MGNTDLVAKQSLSVDGGYQFAISKLITFRLNAFFKNLKNDIRETDGSDYGAIYRWGNVTPEVPEVWGGEVSINYSPSSWIRIQTAYALAHQYDTSWDQTAQIPIHKFYATLNTNPWKQWEFDLYFYYTSSFLTEDYVTDTIARVNPIDMLNARIGYYINKNMQLSLIGYNILRVNYGITLHSNGVDTEHSINGTDKIGRRFILQFRYSY